MSESFIYKGDGAFGSAIYTLKNDKVYKGDGAFGSAIYTIKGKFFINIIITIISSPL